MSHPLRLLVQVSAVVVLSAAATWLTAPAPALRLQEIQNLRPSARGARPQPATPVDGAEAVKPASESRPAVEAFRAVGGTVTMTSDGTVRAVNLTGTSISDDDLRHLAATPQLTLLNLDGTNITDDGLRHIRDLPELSILRLCRTPITDAGLERLDRLPKLSTLVLDDTAVTDAGMIQLVRLPSLGSITAMGCPVTDRAQEIIREHLPGCRVKR